VMFSTEGGSFLVAAAFVVVLTREMMDSCDHY
jgi:hypothetical protein